MTLFDRADDVFDRTEVKEAHSLKLSARWVYDWTEVG